MQQGPLGSYISKYGGMASWSRFPANLWVPAMRTVFGSAGVSVEESFPPSHWRHSPSPARITPRHSPVVCWLLHPRATIRIRATLVFRHRKVPFPIHVCRLHREGTVTADCTEDRPRWFVWPIYPLPTSRTANHLRFRHLGNAPHFGSRFIRLFYWCSFETATVHVRLAIITTPWHRRS